MRVGEQPGSIMGHETVMAPATDMDILRLHSPGERHSQRRPLPEQQDGDSSRWGALEDLRPRRRAKTERRAAPREPRRALERAASAGIEMDGATSARTVSANRAASSGELATPDREVLAILVLSSAMCLLMAFTFYVVDFLVGF